MQILGKLWKKLLSDCTALTKEDIQAALIYAGKSLDHSEIRNAANA